MVYLSDTFFTSAYSRIAYYRQIILDYLATREQLEDKASDQHDDKGQGQGQDKGSVQDKDKDKDKGKDKDKSSLKGSEKDKSTTSQRTAVVVPLPFPHTLISMILTVWAASTCLRRISALTTTEAVDQDQEQSNNQSQGQDKSIRTTAITNATDASDAMAVAAPLISDRPLPPLLLLLADLTRATFRCKIPYSCAHPHFSSLVSRSHYSTLICALF